MSTVQTILATNSALLPTEWDRSGCHSATESELMAAIEAAGVFFGPRTWLENTTNFRQPIPYVLMVDREPSDPECRFVCYRRTSKGGESRLHDKYSIGLGGHVDIGDAVVSGHSVNLRFTLENAGVREVQEEIGREVNPLHRHWLCSIVNNDDEVGRVHLGLVWVWLMRPEFVPPYAAEDHLDSIGYMTAGALTKLNLEPWSKMLLSHVTSN